MLKGLMFFLLSFLFLFPCVRQANADEFKVAYVNMERVIREAPAAIEANSKIAQEFEGRRLELQQIANDITSRQADLSEKKLLVSDSQRQIKEAELSKISASFERRQQEFQEDLKIAKNREISAIFDKVTKAIIQIAESEHLDIVFQEAISVSNRLDISDKVIKKLAGD